MTRTMREGEGEVMGGGPDRGRERSSERGARASVFILCSSMHRKALV